jgi:hypothetical protein
MPSDEDLGELLRIADLLHQNMRHGDQFETDHEIAGRCIIEGVLHLRRQKKVVDLLRARNLDTRLAEAFLMQHEDLLASQVRLLDELIAIKKRS